MSIPQTILKQIGNKALVMIGAKNFVSSEGNTLSFKIGRNAKGVNHIRIKYDEGNDLYNMEFLRVWGQKITTKATHEGVYVDMMHDLIEQETGMYTKLF